MKTSTHIPDMQPVDPKEFFRGWWTGAPVFFVIGLAVGVLLKPFIN